MKKRNECFFIVGFSFIAAPAYAYIDPSVGSLGIQSLIAIFAIIGTVVRLYWQKIKLAFYTLKKPARTNNINKPSDTD